MDDLDEVLARLDQVVRAAMEAYATPGLALALTDRRSTLAVRTYGYADVAARAPVRPETLFETGSIGKSFTAAALMQLHEEGRLDLHAPVTDYLPWFEVRSEFAPIAVHHLLNHTAGIVEGSDITSDSHFDVLALRDTEAGAPPGERFWYSNIGYRALGFVLEELEGRPYEEIVRNRVLTPAGMDATEAVITNRIRGRLAVGYSPHPDDRPVRHSDPQMPAPWLETGTGDGSQASTADDMAGYLRVWLNRGQGDRGPVIRPESFELMTVGAAVEKDVDGWYGYGLRTRIADGRTYLGHGGDMPGYASSMYGEPETGFGAVVLINGIDWDNFPLDVDLYALRLLRAHAEGNSLPPVPPPPDPMRVPNSDELAATYVSAEDGSAITLRTRDGGLELGLGDVGIPLERHGEDSFLVPEAGFDRFVLRGERRDERVVAMVHGPRRWDRDGEAEESVPPDPTLLPFEGHYRSPSPWLTNFRVVQRNGRLVWIHPDGGEEPMTRLDGTTFRLGADEWSPERIRFDAVVDGRALRANRSGCDYYRAFTP